MNEVIEKEQIESLIYIVRGVEVMLDSDLAKLYECVNGTKTINQAVKRHLNKFPERYMFQLDKNEYEKLRFQNGTLEKNGQGQYSKYLPFVFTEQGVAMLATILKGKKTSQMTLQIMDAFVLMKNYISEELIKRIKNHY